MVVDDVKDKRSGAREFWQQFHDMLTRLGI